MKKEIFEEVEIPEGVKLNVGNNYIETTGKEGTIKKEMNMSNLELNIKGNKLSIGSKKATKSEKKMIYTILSHVKNLIGGAQKKYEYKMKICFNHFPITIDLNGKEAVIKNFLGEKIPRRAKIIDDVEVKVTKDMVLISSKNKEAAGQTAANFETATKIRNRDRRVFQDGIFIINKCGKDI